MLKWTSIFFIIKKLFVLCFALTSALVAPAFPKTAALCRQVGITKGTKPWYIRVLLEEGSCKKRTTFDLSCPEGFYILRSPTSKKNTRLRAKNLKVLISSDEISLKKEGTILKNGSFKRLFIAPAIGSLSANGQDYSGVLMFETKKNQFKVINWVDLEEYIYSVLRYEVYQSWPIEMHKVQAIASRTYAARCMKEARENGREFDIKNNNFHQVYNGTHKYSHLRKAIQETRNTILAYNGEPAVTMFDACCGGCIPAKMGYFDFEKTPYLARNYPCRYCKNYSLYRWQESFNFDDLANMLRSHPETCKTAKSAGRLKNIKAKKIDGAGIAHEVMLCGRNQNVELGGTAFFEVVRKKAKSRSFDISKNGWNIILSGRGFGHLVGMCQRGARELVKRGWNVKRILSFYYPGTRLSRLTTL